MSALKWKKEKIIAMIPARMGSARLRMKNLALLGGKPLIYYAIHAARKSRAFNRIVINSEDTIFSKIAKRYNVEFYQRPSKHATAGAKSDSVVYDFIQNNPCDIVVWVNPIAPLQTAEEIKKAVNHFIKEKLDTLITVKDEQVHCIYKGRPVNFKKKGLFAKTQDLKPVRPFVYSLMMWKADPFVRAFKNKGYALLSGKVGFYPVSKTSSIIIKRDIDLIMADAMLCALSGRKKYKVNYDSLAKRG